MEMAKNPHCSGSVLFEFHDYQGSVRVRVPVKFVKKGSGSLCSDSMITRLRFGPGSMTIPGFGFCSGSRQVCKKSSYFVPVL